MSKKSLIPRILSPAEAQEQLPLPCLFVLLGVAQPVFPTRDRGTPSPVVLIHKVKDYGGKFGLSTAVLPFPVEWRQWQRSVIPVLEDERWRVRGNPVVLLDTDGVDGLLADIGWALRTSFIEGGWGT